MAALTKDRITETKLLGINSYPVNAATKIFAGSMVALDSTGMAVPAADAASLKVVGIARALADNTNGGDGDVRVQVDAPIRAKLTATSITAAMVGQQMYIVDDQTFDDTLGTNGVKAGKLVEFVSTTEGWVEIRPAGVGVVLADIGAFTDPPSAAEMALLRSFVNNLKAVINSWM